MIRYIHHHKGAMHNPTLIDVIDVGDDWTYTVCFSAYADALNIPLGEFSWTTDRLWTKYTNDLNLSGAKA